MSAGLQSKIVGAAAYLEVAPTVVAVVRDLDLGEIDSRITPPDDAARAQLAALAASHNLASPVERVLAALSR